MKSERKPSGNTAYQVNPHQYHVKCAPHGIIIAYINERTDSAQNGWWVNPQTTTHAASRGAYATPQAAVKACRWLKIDAWEHLDKPAPAKRSKPSKAQERATIERRFAKRLIAEYDACVATWEATVKVILRDSSRLRPWALEHGKKCGPEMAAANVGFVFQADDGTYRVLPWDMHRRLAEDAAGAPPDLRTMFAAAIDDRFQKDTQ